MSKDQKIVVIVLASLTGILLFAFVGMFAFVALGAFRAATNFNDPGKNTRTAAQIADFRLPPGYRVFTALDFGLVKMAIVAPTGRPKSDFMMELEGMSVPGSAGQSDADTMRSLQQGMSIGARCATLQTIGEDRVTTSSGRELVMSVSRCADQGSGRIVEFGRIPAKVPLGVFMAEGRPNSFDRTAVHALLQSLR